MGQVKPWRTGRLLMTNQTKRWTAEQIAEGQQAEAVRVFSDFSSADEGRSRQAICTAVSPQLAGAISQLPALVNLVQQLLDNVQTTGDGMLVQGENFNTNRWRQKVEPVLDIIKSNLPR